MSSKYQVLSKSIEKGLNKKSPLERGFMGVLIMALSLK